MKKVQKVWVVIKEGDDDASFVIGAARTSRMGRMMAEHDFESEGAITPIKWTGRVLLDDHMQFSNEEWRAVTADESHELDSPLYVVIEMPLE